MSEIDPARILASRTVLKTDDVATFHDYIAGLEGGHERRVSGSGPVEIELRAASLGHVQVAVAYSSVGMTLEATRDPSRPFLLQFPLSGHIHLRIDGEEIGVAPGGGLVMSPSTHVVRRSSPGWTLGLQMERRFVYSRLAHSMKRAPRGQVRFVPLLTGRASALRAYSLLVADAIDRGLAAERGPIAGALERGLVDLLVELQPHSHSGELQAAGGETDSTRILAVEAYVGEHLEDPIRIDTLAEAAGCSVRSLQMLFLEQCGCTPMNFVKRQRLAHARGFLKSGDSGVTVASVALRVGFSHLGKFSRSYREHYGELPSDTLRRAAGRPADRRS